MPVVTRRNYSQFCGLAHALDVVGERWTLLIVRELATGAKRYTQLADALPGIGTSLLATRVRQLESDGVIERRLVLDQSSAVAYELTEAGRELANAMVPLALWGARHQMTDERADDEVFRAEWALSFLAGGGAGDVPAGIVATYQFHVDESVACLHLRDGRMRVTPGVCATSPDVTVRATARTLTSIAGQRISLADAVEQGLLEVTGDAAARAALLELVERRLTVLGHA